jgi:UPF0716 protein FxsA
MVTAEENPMLFRLFLLFALLPVAEIYLLVKAGGVIGAWPTVAVVLGTGMAGAWLARQQGMSVVSRIRENMARGVAPTGELADAALILVAGVLLITPGFITDFTGLLLLLPPARAAIKAWLLRWVQQGMASGRIHVAGAGFGPQYGPRPGPHQEREINPQDRPQDRPRD